MPIQTYPSTVASGGTTNITNNYGETTLLRNPNYLDRIMINMEGGEGGALYIKYHTNSSYSWNTANFWSYIDGLPYDDSFVTQPITEDSLQTILNTTGSGKFYGLITANIGSSATHYVKITIDGTEYTITFDPTDYSRTVLGLNLKHQEPETSSGTDNSPCIGGYNDYGWKQLYSSYTLSPSTHWYNTKYIIYDTSLKIEYYVSDIDSGTYDGYFYTSYVEDDFITS